MFIRGFTFFFAAGVVALAESTSRLHADRSLQRVCSSRDADLRLEMGSRRLRVLSSMGCGLRFMLGDPRMNVQGIHLSYWRAASCSCFLNMLDILSKPFVQFCSLQVLKCQVRSKEKEARDFARGLWHLPQVFVCFGAHGLIFMLVSSGLLLLFFAR